MWYNPVIVFRLHTSRESENTYHLYLRRTRNEDNLSVFFFAFMSTWHVCTSVRAAVTSLWKSDTSPESVACVSMRFSRSRTSSFTCQMRMVRREIGAWSLRAISACDLSASRCARLRKRLLYTLEDLAEQIRLLRSERAAPGELFGLVELDTRAERLPAEMKEHAAFSARAAAGHTMRSEADQI